MSVAIEQITRRIVARQPGRTEADLQADIVMLLTIGDIGLDESDVVRSESQLGDGTRRRIDVEVGHLIIEVKKDLARGNALPDFEAQLAGYVQQREREFGGRFAGVLTDGMHWRLYRMTTDALALVTELVMSDTAPDTDLLLVWLESIMATRTQVKPTPAAVDQLLGAGSPAHQYDHATLRDLLHAAADDEEVRLKRELWSKLLKTAFGEAFRDSDGLFVNHTLLVITAELIAHAIVGYDIAHGSYSAGQIVSGDLFAQSQVYGVVEQDFFDWPALLPGGQQFVDDLARRIARFDWADVQHDILKVLYESVIEQRDREALGEYYTPDWLAAAMVADRVTTPLHQVVLDPACGSGTFLFHAVRAYLDAVGATDIGPGAAATQATEHVFGIDVHPVAVTLARVTYLLALGTARLTAPDRGELTVPVFLGDSLQWERHADLFTTDDGVRIDTSTHELVGGSTLFDEALAFPASVWEHRARFDRLVIDMSVAVERGDGVDLVLDRHSVTAASDRQMLTDTFNVWVGLHRSNRDRVWGYYVRNLVKPSWLALPANRVDVLVGNPPWLRYNKMTAAMQARYKELAGSRALLTGGLGASARDLSTLFVVRAIELYLKPGGVFGFVMPFGTLSRKPHTGFRGGNWQSDESNLLCVSFEQPWDLSGVPNLFPMTSCVVRGCHTQGDYSAMPTLAMRWAGPTRGTPAHPVGGADIAAIDAGAQAASDYEKRFRQGAILVPRMALFVDRATGGPLGAGAGRVAVTSARSSQEKPPWKQMPSLSGVVEAEFVVPVHLGETIGPFCSLGPRDAVLPVDDHGILTDAQVQAHPALAAWWSGVETTWRAGRATSENAPLHQRMDFNGQLSAQLPLRPNRVVYAASGNTLTAARLGAIDHALIEHSLYWASFTTPEEALFVVGVLNTQTLLQQVARYQAVGLFGARHFDKYVFQVGIPTYNASDPLHRRIVEAAQAAETAARAMGTSSAQGFVAARKAITAELHAHGLLQPLEDAVAELLVAG